MEARIHTTRSADGTAIGYEVTGNSGPPLLLVHGTTADRGRWARIVPALAARYTVYAMDRRGRGSSGDEAGEYRLALEGEDVAAVVDAIGGDVRVLGHSYGAVAVLEAALLTEGIREMVLYEPPIPTGLPMYPPGLPDRMQSLIDRGQSEEALEIFFREVVRMPEREFEGYRRLPAWPTRVRLAPTIPREVAIDRSYRFDPAKFADLDTPTTLLLGGDSPPLFQRAAEVVSEALPASRVVVLEGQQHIAMDTDPEGFVRTVLQVLE